MVGKVLIPGDSWHRPHRNFAWFYQPLIIKFRTWNFACMHLDMVANCRHYDRMIVDYHYSAISSSCRNSIKIFKMADRNSISDRILLRFWLVVDFLSAISLDNWRGRLTINKSVCVHLHLLLHHKLRHILLPTTSGTKDAYWNLIVSASFEQPLKVICNCCWIVKLVIV